MSLRAKRYYLPFTIQLKKFSHDRYTGTEMAKNFASEVRLVDPRRHEDCEVKIWMNHPLRYGGDTFYQQSFANNDNTSVLQVVRNPAWTWPYFACGVGALGLILHFGMNLLGFLQRKIQSRGKIPIGLIFVLFLLGILPGLIWLVLALTTNLFSDLKANADKFPAKGRIPKRPGDQPDRYTLKPEPAWKMAGIPLLIISIAFVAVISQLFNSAPTEPYDFNAFGRLPMFSDGRTQPFDSVARNSLSVVSGGKTTFKDEKGTVHPAIEWLADIMTRSHKWADDKVIRIDHPQVKDLLGLKEEEKLFSWNDMKFDDPQVRARLDEQWKLAGQVADKDRDAFQNQVIELHQHLGIYYRLMQADSVAFQLELMANPDKTEANRVAIRKAFSDANPQLLADIAAKKIDDPEKAVSDAFAKLDRKALTPEQIATLEKPAMLDALERMGQEGQLLLIPPEKYSDSWQGIMSVTKAPEAMPESAKSLLKIFKDYADSRSQDFNSDVAAYQARLQSLPDIKTVDYEVGFNRVAPFMLCIVLYVSIFILAVFSWLFWTKPFLTSGYGLLILALVIHTIGVISRIYISGRPPVTNLYSASVFIGWAIVAFSIGIESIFRNGIGLVAGSVAGFLSLLVAAGFAVGEGDTMKQLQAVLDTNIWLATHVVCVTMGYMATVLSGILAIIYVVRGLFDRSFAGDNAKDNARMIYGITCFAMLFSFVGTILGGIWADQSWGRFWGWDPKENGAVLVVLWNALILHARWSGIVRERGVAGLAILGNIVVGWSFVGTNLLGIGLHSYGFMSGAQLAVLGWSGFNLLLACVCLIPKKYWTLFRDGAADKAGLGSPAIPLARRV